MHELARAAVSRGPADGYCDRIRPPAETVRLVRPHFDALGITRLARQTALDRIGIPCWAAFRPNALTLSNNQGKGLDDDSAKASAVMEALEFSVAERGCDVAARSTIRKLGRGKTVPLSRQLPIGRGEPADLILSFAHGRDLASGHDVFVASDCVGLGPANPELADLARSTNGLASGNTESEAVVHGVLELIERDGSTLASLQPPRPIAPETLGSPDVDELTAKLDAADFDLWLLDQTTDLGIPVFKAVIGDRRSGYWQHLDLAAGYGAHLHPARAAIRAITEAAQTRVTNIAGSRDDVFPGEYRRHGDAERRTALSRPSAGRPWSADVVSEPRDPEAILAHLLERTAAAGVGSVVCVALPAQQFGVSVVKVLAPDLEDRSCNRNWRPGPRALRSLMAAA